MNSKVNRAYQHSQRNKTQDSEYVRYREECDGRPYDTEELNNAFSDMIVSRYQSCSLTVNEIIGSTEQLLIFSERIALATFEPEKVDESLVGKKFSFCNYVAKRLVLLRKAGKLVRKKFTGEYKRVRKTKQSKQGATGGTMIRKVE